MPYCIMCGAELAPDDKFCYACGAAVEPDAPTEDAPSQQPSQQAAQQMPSQMPRQQQDVIVEATAVEEPVHVCSKCGARLKAENNFCMHCGGKATVRMVKNLLHHTLRAPPCPGEFTVPIGQSLTGGMPGMQPAMAVLSAGVQAVRSASQQSTQSGKSKKKQSKFAKFAKKLGMRFVWAAISAAISYGGYYFYQHKGEIWNWITNLFS